MKAETFFVNDIKGVVAASAEKTLGAARMMISKYASPEELVASKFWATLNAQTEWAFLTALGAIADEAGRPRVGNSLGDTIMAQQASRVRQYGQTAYRLSEKQALVVLREIFPYFAA